MKTTLLDSHGKKKSEISLPKIFSTKIREDIVSKFYEADKFLEMQPYSNSPRAGKKHSASGTISHKRHDWKGHYGRGISRVPRKTMWRRGTQFFWVGAEISGARGGRRSHPPTNIKRIRKINKKEVDVAIGSAFAATTHQKYLKGRYSSLDKIEFEVPLVIDKLPEKTKDLIKTLKHVLKDNYKLAARNKTVRSGKGKTRGRKYKSNAGILIVTSELDKSNMKGFDIKTVQELSISDLYPLGRLTIFTEKALKEMGGEK